MSNLSIKDFYSIYATDGKITVEELEHMTQSGLININDEQLIYSIDEISKILNKSKRSMTYWIENKKLMTIAVENGSRVVTNKELKRILKETPIQKSKRCIYIKADNIEEVNKYVKEIISGYDIDKYRSRIFIDIEKDEGLEELLSYALEKKGVEIYSNIDLMRENKYIKSILNATNCKLITVKK